ncbi:MAG: hypothetical protein ACD_4C00472G0001 [uncultured bacterium (gcode 4)]|uniref:Uncharacterized protein n=1 Tax=uncultured bacterium (gcode 4) TaxID=1234023 RepID=K2FSZ5_9BACT|nr:MAG: hypothetical protein ACD_4C00472G0001 [uncultured bacterium (gcode 4)]
MELFCELLDYYKIQIDKEEKIMIEHDYDNIEYLTKILFPIQLSIIQKKYNNIREWTLIFITENIVEQIKEIIINNIQCDRSFIVFLKTKYHGKIEGILR